VKFFNQIATVCQCDKYELLQEKKLYISNIQSLRMLNKQTEK